MLLGHLYPNRVELGEEGGAAERAPTVSQPASHLRFVAHPHLMELHAGAKGPGQVPHQRAEVDPSFGTEVNDDARAVEGRLRLDELHRQPVLGDLPGGDLHRLPLAPGVALVFAQVILAGQADDRPETVLELIARHLRRPRAHGAQLQAS